ncbi:MFS transporter [Sphaerisporangium sp. TRM90804]|uniref:MFS transporter n=1 Tax=Sphaerisporangium sp. TRM90804 TaxID=3031113 RepID=UPI00244D30A1|nr:MFS transporter [Sphaerisporangium sp. TRM90804]MDH2429191.1 MFS transporter [Sphaerisporangium sp. TRM90804]
MTSGYRPRFALMIFAIAGMNIGYTAILPFIPELQGELGLTPALLTVFLIAYPVAKIVSQWALGGRLTDRWGPAPTAVVAWLSGTAGMALIAVADGPWAAVAGRLVWGVGTGLGIPAIYKATGMMADHYGVPVSKLRSFVGAGAVLTLALGPVVAGLVQIFAGFRVVLLAGAALSVAGAVTAAYAMRVPAATPTAGVAEAPAPAGARSGGWGMPLLVFGLYELILNLLFAASEPLVPLYVAGSQHDATGRSALILGVGLAVWMLATLLSGRVSERLRSPAAGTVSLVVLGGSCLAMTEIGDLGIGLLAFVVFMVAQGHGYLVARDGIDRYTDASGTVWGRFNAIADVGFLVGPVVAVAAYSSVERLAFPLVGAVALVAAAGFALAASRLRRRTTLLPAPEPRASVHV